MSRENNGRWLLVMVAAVSLAVPGVVAAQQHRHASGVAEPAITSSQRSAPAGELRAAGDRGPLNACGITACQTTAQCRLWCEDSTAWCVPRFADDPRGLKFCQQF